MSASLDFPAVEVRSDDEYDFAIQRAFAQNTLAIKRPLTTEEKQEPKQKSKGTGSAKPRAGSFPALGLNAELCSALSRAGYGFPTPIQRRAIPPALAGRDVVVMARTGSGKTAAFLAPVLQRLKEASLLLGSSHSNGPRALIIAPTRELALQTFKFSRLYSKGSSKPVRVAAVVGGTPIDAQFSALAVCPELIIATPGRLLQILAEMGVKRGLTLSTAEIVVFDEADRLFEGTLATETAALLARLSSSVTESSISNDRQTILVSATMPRALAEFSRTGLRQNVQVIRLDAAKSLSPTLAVGFLNCRGRDEKDAALLLVIHRILNADKTAIVFAGTHRCVEYLTFLLRELATPHVDCIHGNMDQVARVESVSRFRKGKSKILIVTDVAARGIDLPELDNVVNYDMPATPKLFVHRVGRAGRAGRPGMAISIVSSDEIPYMLDVHLFLGRGITFSSKEACDSVDNGAIESSTTDPWSSISVAMNSSFVFGSLPKASLDLEIELVRRTYDHVEIGGLRKSANNAHGLYLRTRSVASGESVKRSRSLLVDNDGGLRVLPIHPWMADMDTKAEQEATQFASKLSSWRPKESAVQVPQEVLNRRRRAQQRAMEENNNFLGIDLAKHLMQGSSKKDKLFSVEENGDINVESAAPYNAENEEAVGKGKALSNFNTDLADEEDRQKKRKGKGDPPKAAKKSVRQMFMEQQRHDFFVPLQPSNSEVLQSKGLKVSTGGAMNDGFGAFRAIQNATMDINADTNVDLLRSKHMGMGTTKFWDRVSKKFVKGGVTDATSKRNLHVASREARAKAQGEQNYSLGDGEMYKKWLSRNRKAVAELQELQREGIESGKTGPGPQSDLASFGFGHNDFRKGTFGRRARIAAAASRNAASAGSQGKAGGRRELKTAEKIAKERKLKQKAESRRQGKLKKGKAGASSVPPANVGRPSRVRVISRGKRR